MDTVYIRMLTTVGENQEGETYEIDKETADKWVAAGLCEVVEAPEQEAEAKFRKALEERDNKLIDQLSKSLRQVNVKVPAVARGNDETKSYGEFVKCVHRTFNKHYSADQKQKAHNILAEKYYSQKVLVEGGDGTTAGFTVPEEYSNEILRVEAPAPQLWDSIRKVNCGTDTIHWPVLDQTKTPSNGSSAFNGGMSVAFVNESTAPSAESTAYFKQLSLAPKKIMAYTEVSNELLDDNNVGLQDEIMGLFKDETRSYLDYQILKGSANFEGIVDNAANVKVARATAGKFTLTDAAKMFSRFTGADGLWVVHPYEFEQLANMNTTNNAISWLPGLNGKPVMSLLGFNVIKSQHSPAPGSAGDVLLVDLSKYIAALRKDLVIATSDSLRFLEDRTVFKMVMRAQGKAQLTAPILLSDGESYVSPFVQLDDVAS